MFVSSLDGERVPAKGVSDRSLEKQGLCHSEPSCTALNTPGVAIRARFRKRRLGSGHTLITN